jgi:quinoprotein dehydrogenase-associated probable ABC transporter substrate-binding protein
MLLGGIMRPTETPRRNFEFARFLAALLAAFVIWQIPAARAQDANGEIELVDPKVLRVCADPHHLPFSNDKGEGFENKIAALLAQKLGKRLAYTYYPDSTGFIKNTLNAIRCDLVIGIGQGTDLVQTTNPYYRTSYMLVTKKDSDMAGVDSLADPKLKSKRLGMTAGSSPATYVASNNLLDKAKSYPLVVDSRFSSPEEQMIKDLESGTIDGAILWGPMGGYFVKNSKSALSQMLLVKETNGPQMVYRISMGVRHTDQHWKRVLNKLLAANAREINDILSSYGVPLLDEKDMPIAQ